MKDDPIQWMRDHPPHFIEKMAYEPDAAHQQSLIKRYGAWTSVFGIQSPSGQRIVRIKVSQGPSDEYDGPPLLIAEDGSSQEIVVFNPVHDDGWKAEGAKENEGFAELLESRLRRRMTELVDLSCLKCSGKLFTLALGFQYDDSVDELTDPELYARRQDFFGCLAASVLCVTCGHHRITCVYECA